MVKVLFKKTGEIEECESLEFAKQLIKLSVMVNNERDPIHRDSKRNYEIIMDQRAQALFIVQNDCF